MPINPVAVENPYGLPPLDSEEDTREQLRRALIEESQAIRTAHGVQDVPEGQLVATKSAFALGGGPPMLNMDGTPWKPAPEPLPVNKRDHVRTVLGSRERQLRALEQFASDPKNPASQEEVERIRGQIEAESQRALQNATLPSPVSMYESLVDAEQPEVAKARLSEGLQTFFGEEWDSGLSALIDPSLSMTENAKSIQSIMKAKTDLIKAKGTDEAAGKTQKAAEAFALGQLERQRPDPKQYDLEDEDDATAFETATTDWENKMQAHFRRFNPDAAKLLPTFAEEQGFTEAPRSPGFTRSGFNMSPDGQVNDPGFDAPRDPSFPGDPGFNVSAGQSAPAESPFAAEEVRQLSMRFEANGTPTTVAGSLEELQQRISDGVFSPGDIVIVSTPHGAVAAKLESNGQFRQVGRFSRKR